MSRSKESEALKGLVEDSLKGHDGAKKWIGKLQPKAVFHSAKPFRGKLVYYSDATA